MNILRFRHFIYSYLKLKTFKGNKYSGKLNAQMALSFYFDPLLSFRRRIACFYSYGCARVERRTITVHKLHAVKWQHFADADDATRWSRISMVCNCHSLGAIRSSLFEFCFVEITTTLSYVSSVILIAWTEPQMTATTFNSPICYTIFLFGWDVYFKH